ncbi:TonB-dependent receptor domain-containing protein [Sphingomonas sp. MMS24-JH45]
MRRAGRHLQRRQLAQLHLPRPRRRGGRRASATPEAARTNATRDSYAGYLEFDADLFTGLSAAVAGRYRRFSDFGDTLNGKLALRYELVDGFAIRSSVSNGFRAPSLHQQFFTTTSTNFLAEHAGRRVDGGGQQPGRARAGRSR